MIGYAIEGYSRECPPWDSVRKLYIKLSIKLLGKNANTKGLRSKALHQAYVERLCMKLCAKFHVGEVQWSLSEV